MQHLRALAFGELARQVDGDAGQPGGAPGHVAFGHAPREQRAPTAVGVAVARHHVDDAIALQRLLGGLLHGLAIFGVDAAAHGLEVDAVGVLAHAHDAKAHGIEEDAPREQVDAPYRDAGQYQRTIQEFGGALVATEPAPASETQTR